MATEKHSSRIKFDSLLDRYSELLEFLRQPGCIGQEHALDERPGLRHRAGIEACKGHQSC